ncbi:glycosyltransferase family 2 protein [Actinomadura flavalba]|uniref:glycosyltransferase family 2 protein n=1 Tax=Actinomadura flavalba TaxID=1120938 RepID=UPI00036CC40F|nr:glycosyltransferase [Actinomadura flavalba]
MSPDQHAAPRPPRVRHNDHTSLDVPAVGGYTPRRTVSVVVPAFEDQTRLDLTLASLAAQSYPEHLLEVVVVDDGSTPPLRLPEIAPARTRLVPADPGGWGRGHARATGARVADGEVVHWLDADMVVFREHVEAQLRWHHVADYLVVLGYKRFIDHAPGELTPAKVAAAVAADAADTLFGVEEGHPHTWVEDIIAETGGLVRFHPRLYRVHVGATASVPASLLTAAGGLDASLLLGEDTDLGYRLAQQGAVFVPEPGARSWHLGPSTIMRRREEVARHNEPYLSHRLPLRRDWRRWAGRQFDIPYTDIVVHADGATFEDVRATVAGALAGTVPDIRVTVAGPWSALTDGRRAPLDDPDLDLRLIRAAFAADGRVRFVEDVPATSAPAPFRLVCPPGLVPGPEAIQRLVALADEGGHGAVQVAVDDPGGGLRIARFERTAALARAHHVRAAGEDLDDVVHELYGVHWIDGADWAFPAGAGRTAPPTATEVDKWRKEAARWKKRAEQREKEAERWKQEAARLKRKLQAPLSAKLREAARRRAGEALHRRSPDDRNA